MRDGWTRPCFEAMEPRLLLAASAFDGKVVINEIHYDPDVKTEAVEFIELINTTAATIELDNWTLADGIEYTFPVNTDLPANGYLVIAENPTAFHAKWSTKTAIGPWVGDLANEGETITLRDAAGDKVDEVDYNLGFPWPTVGDSPGYSIELINPAFDNSLGGNWRAHVAGTGASTTLITNGSTWDYRKGTSEASSPIGAWRQLGFIEDASWFTSAPAPVGYDASLAMGATLGDMRNNYMSVYLRKTFTVADLALIGSLRMEVLYDDGFNVWINGTRVTWSNVSKENMLYSDASSGTARESNTFDTFNLPDPSTYLVQGTNVIAVQFHNINLRDSSDAFFDCRLIAGPASARSNPTPGERNSVYAVNAAPQMRQVEHHATEPQSGQAVTITAKVTDPDGVQSVTLQYQLVDAGSYIAIEDAAYQTTWTSLTMVDDGTGGDEVAGDSVYTVTMPASMQVNRRLVRYRVTAVDNSPAHLSITGPYADDPQPNFAYFVYDGVPAWTGADQPGVTSPVTYGTDVMRSVPAYHLISKSESVMDATWVDKYGGDAYLWSGTLVYDGQVYDNIHFRARGGVWRYAMGKNMWKIDFNRGHYFEARDDYGNKYAVPWDKLNLGSCIQQGDYWHRGEQGLFESVGSALFNLAGVPAMTTHYVQLRIIDSASEAGATQYDGDFWGLYLAVEQEDGRFLDEHDLPDGNLYKMESGAGGGELNNQGPTQVTDNSDLVAFTSTYTNTTPTDQWWRDNLDLEEYYSYRAIVEGIHHGDIGYGKNYFYYHDPVTNKWSVFPWDLDLTWSDNMYGDGNDPFKNRVLPRTAFNLEYQNRLREIRDLLFNTDQTYQLIDEMVSLIHNPSGLSIVDADRAMWDYNPVMANSSYVILGKAGQGRFYQGNPGGGIVIPSPGGFLGMAQKMKNYVVTRSAYIDSTLLTDTQMPYTPTVTYTGPAGYAMNRLSFRSSAFSSSYSTFGAMEWRIAEVTDTANPNYDPSDPRKYEIESDWESGELPTYGATATIPGSAVKTGHSYRVRVRMKDATGRWSHWSAPVQFIAGAPAANPQDALRVTEIMYNAVGGNAYDFLEIQNTSGGTVNLQNAQFVQGVEFTFPNMDLPAGGRCVVVADLAAFRSRYGTSPVVAGTYLNSLSNNGEEIELLTREGATIQEFSYSDGWFPPTDGDGFSLVARDSAQALSL
ncbi:MAG: lamin tail domain-containing protein, partial [Planctomycetes bacterium]|nr:lamin tail domain-containing protein [Planctomycetota bacterium]